MISSKQVAEIIVCLSFEYYFFGRKHLIENKLNKFIKSFLTSVHAIHTCLIVDIYLALSDDREGNLIRDC